MSVGRAPRRRRQTGVHLVGPTGSAEELLGLIDDGAESRSSPSDPKAWAPRSSSHGPSHASSTGFHSIPLDELKYWSVARQEPYATATVSLAREIEMDPSLRSRSR